MQYIKLNNNIQIPILGLGTYPMRGFSLIKSVFISYQNGCRSYDTSPAYQNEKWLGAALKLLRLMRAEDIFITTKLSNQGQREGDIKKAYLDSIKRLGIKQADLYLMHWPNPGTYLNSWKQLEQLYKDGLVRSIGVCNFHQHHLEKLLQIAEVIPAVNQIELHPLLSQKPLREYCQSKGIQIQAYSPLARMDPKLIEHSVLVELSNKYKKTVPQIILKWDIQNKIITIPKSQNINKIKENLNIFDFELTEHEINIIDNINEDYRVRYDPDNVDYTKV